MKSLVFLILVFPIIGFGQPRVIVSTNYSYHMFDGIEALLTTEFNTFDLSAGFRFKESFNVLLGVSYFSNQNLYSSFGKKTENYMLNMQLSYMFMKKYIFRPVVQLDIGGVLYSNLKNQVIRERLLLFTNPPPTITNPDYDFPYSEFKRWGPIITPKALVMIDLNHINILLGVEYTFLTYKVEDRGYFNVPSETPVYRKMVTKGLGYTAGLIYKF